MKVDWEDQFDGIIACYIETPGEIDVVKKHADETGTDISECTEHLAVGGNWSYTLEDLHLLVGMGIILHGLPEWLIVK